VTVTIGNTLQTGSWAKEPWDGVGIYHGNVSMNGATGPVKVTLTTPSSGAIAVSGGPDISTSCASNVINWNAWSGSAKGSTISATPALKINQQVCIAGSGNYNFRGLCEFSCALGYCPIGACFCTQMGKQKPLPTPKNVKGYPIEGEGPEYSGLCSFACNYGYCPATACGYTSYPLVVPTVSPVLPPTCTAGTGEGNFAGLCSYSCNYGFCPMAQCTCTAQGALILNSHKYVAVKGLPINGEEFAQYQDLCQYACGDYGYCPPSACVQDNTSTSDLCIPETSCGGGQDYNTWKTASCAALSSMSKHIKTKLKFADLE
jgi:hypothetical protein